MIYSHKPGVPERVIIGAVVKTIAAFLNSEGGTLAIGVDDNGNPIGIESDLETKGYDSDGYQNFLMTTVTEAIDPVAATRCKVRFESVEEKTVALVDVDPSSRPVYADTDKGKRLFFVRAGNTTRVLDTKDAVPYIADSSV